ncbi:hypothetical protein B0H13DRAFT_2368989 [Mycena leptocephala]|nr:hypothetical protein B0H13DRAFT_2368989 [Mycena leptocephala]
MFSSSRICGITLLLLHFGALRHASVLRLTPAAVMALRLQRIVRCRIAERSVLPYMTRSFSHGPRIPALPPPASAAASITSYFPHPPPGALIARSTPASRLLHRRVPQSLAPAFYVPEPRSYGHMAWARCLF